MSDEQQELAEQLQLILQKANRSLIAARRLFETGDYDFASSRAYYAAFYGVQAALLTKNLSASKHSGVIHLFNQYFVKTAIFPAKFSKFIGDLFRHRQTGDYVFISGISPEIASHDIQMAETVLQTITKYLVQQRFLPGK